MEVVNGKDDIPYIMENHKRAKPPTKWWKWQQTCGKIKSEHPEIVLSGENLWNSVSVAMGKSQQSPETSLIRPAVQAETEWLNDQQDCPPNVPI